MSQENVETIARLYDEYFGRPERITDPGVFEFFDPGVEIRQSLSMLGTEGTFHGYDGLRRSAREIFAVFSGVRFIPKDLKASGDRVVATVEVRASGKESGVDIRTVAAHVWTLRDGRITAWEVYLDPKEALEAAGLSE